MTSEVIAFDFDGTIADSMSALEELASEVLCDYLTDEAARILYRWTTGLPFVEQCRLMFPSVPIAAVEWFEREKENVYWRTAPCPQVLPTLIALHSAGHKLVVVSSSQPRHVREWLSSHHLDDRLEVAVSYETKVQQLVTVGATVFIGDSDRDGEIAKNAGVPFYQVHGNTGVSLLDVARAYL